VEPSLTSSEGTVTPHRWFEISHHRNRRNEADRSRSFPHSSFVIVRQRFQITYLPGAVTSTPLQGLDLPKKLSGERGFAPEAFIARFASQAQLHVTRPCLKGTLQNTQLLFIQFKQHRNAPSEPRGLPFRCSRRSDRHLG
jgi:hypothetical protein